MTASSRLDGDELIATRVVAADRSSVWRAFTQPEHLAAFWGGDHAQIPVDSVAVDLRPGGAFELDTVGPSGPGRRLRFVYRTIDEPTLLVLEEPITGITTTIRLEPNDDGTRVTVHQRRLPPELRIEAAVTGLAGILEQLDHHLQTDPPERGTT